LPRFLPLKGCARDGVSSCPDSRILQLVRLWNFGSPLSPALPVVLLDGSASCPAHRIFRLCRRWIFESPRISHPSALLALNPRVAPNLCCSSCACQCVLWVSPATASSGFAGDGSSSHPEFLVLRRFRSWSFGLPLSFAFRLRLPVGLRVAPRATPSGFALGLSFRVAPNSRSLGAD
jgi:hypothetical protein